MKDTENQQISETMRTRVVDRYIAAWNETDPANRRQLVNQTWTEDSTYVDLLVQGEGREGIDAMIDGAAVVGGVDRHTRPGRTLAMHHRVH